MRENSRAYCGYAGGGLLQAIGLYYGFLFESFTQEILDTISNKLS